MIGRRYLRSIRGWTGAVEFEPTLIFEVAEPSHIEFRYRDASRLGAWRAADVDLACSQIARLGS